MGIGNISTIMYVLTYLRSTEYRVVVGVLTQASATRASIYLRMFSEPILKLYVIWLLDV